MSKTKLKKEAQLSPLIERFAYPDFHVVRTIFVSFGSSEFVGQTEIPGSLDGHTQLCFGLHKISETGSFEWLNDSRMDNLINSLSDEYRFGESKIMTGDIIKVPVEFSAYEGSDGQLYLKGFCRITPRDPNFADENAFFRPEALSNYELDNALESHREELIQLGGSPDHMYLRDPDAPPLDEEPAKKLQEARNKVILEVSKEKYDMNALTPYSFDPTFVPENIQKLATYVKEKLVKKFAALHCTIGSLITDGKTLVSEMHDNGLNVRYLAQIDAMIPDELLWPHVLISSEILARSVKNYIRDNKLTAKQISELLKLISNDPENAAIPWADFSSISEKKFGKAITKDSNWE